MKNAEFYLNYCQVIESGSMTIAQAPSVLVAEGLRRCGHEIAIWLGSIEKKCLQIRFPGDGGLGYEIWDWFASVGNTPTKISVSTPLSEILPEIADPQWQATASSLDVPVWIFRHFDLKVLYANNAALSPQAKPSDQILDHDASSLDKPEELNRIAMNLERDGYINAMEFNGYRWGVMPENKNIFTRVEHTFVEHWKLINWEGQQARLGVVLSAVPVIPVTV